MIMIKKGTPVVEIPEKSDSKIFVLLSLIFGIAAVVSTIAYIGYSIYSKTQHQKKWKDYNDCGLA